MRLSTRAVERETGTPVMLFDMKSAITRLSSYVITNDCLMNDDKIELLSFIYEVVLWAAAVRSALLATLHMPIPQMKRLMRKVSASSPSQPLSNAAQNDSSSSTDQDEVNPVEAMRYTCTDLSRYIGELWHECRIKRLPDNFKIGHTSLEQMHHFLTGSEQLSISYLPAASLNNWIKVISRWIPFIAHTLKMEALVWRRFTILELPTNYDDLFSRFFGRSCLSCGTIPRNPFICLLCSEVVCLDSCCVTSTGGMVPDNEVERHAIQCGSGVACFLSLNTSLIVIVTRHKAALWGSVYLDIHGEEDRNLRRGKPLFLSARRFARLRSDWVRQSFEQQSMSFFTFDHLPTFLRDAHYVLSS
ncbi:unnamed protein product [Anisakis simplex]|uniref:E3 ubiquitin-protein ligase n=1 Tax=Anisakis simplex TaxID=6269 RepID=A0A0M3J0G6_ANISI|nr:unnamed protein product [Anisakis simplex]